MGGGKTHVKINCESLMLKVMPILTLQYTAHRHNLQQKYWRASWSKNLRFGSWSGYSDPAGKHRVRDLAEKVSKTLKNSSFPAKLKASVTKTQNWNRIVQVKWKMMLAWQGYF